MDAQTVLFISPENDVSRHLARIVEEVLAEDDATVDWQLEKWWSSEQPGEVMPELMSALRTSGAIIAEITDSNPNVFYEMGAATAWGRPVILLRDADTAEPVAFDAQGRRHIPYRSAGRIVDTGYVPTLKEALSSALSSAKQQLALIGTTEAEGRFVPLTEPVDLRRLKPDDRVVVPVLENPSAAAGPPPTRTDINRLFISYSHHDSDFKDRLLVHLRPLEREGRVDIWVDTRIEAGDEWKTEIEAALKQARAAVLLISADFLASDFVVDDELPPLLEAAESGGTRILPVIVKPCRFSRDPRLGKFQSVNDPTRALSGLPDFEQEKIYDAVALAVESTMPQQT